MVNARNPWQRYQQTVALVLELVGGRALPCVIHPGDVREKGCGNPVSEKRVGQQNIRIFGLVMGMDFFFT